MRANLQSITFKTRHMAQKDDQPMFQAHNNSSLTIHSHQRRRHYNTIVINEFAIVPHRGKLLTHVLIPAINIVISHQSCYGLLWSFKSP